MHCNPYSWKVHSGFRVTIFCIVLIGTATSYDTMMPIMYILLRYGNNLAYDDDFSCCAILCLS